VPKRVTLRVIGWTQTGPELNDGSLRHAEAEASLGRQITCIYVQLDDPQAAIAAGAPATWNEPWRCLAIAPAGSFAHSEDTFHEVPGEPRRRHVVEPRRRKIGAAGEGSAAEGQ
jgi:hypothetical protein